MDNQNEIAEQLRQLSRLYVNAEKYRNKYGNMMLGKVQFLDNEAEEWDTYFKTQLKSVHAIELDLQKKIVKLLPLHEWSKWLLSIKGVGPIIAASVIGELNGAIYGAIEKDHKVTKADLKGYGRTFESTADLWSYAGWSVVDGKAKKRQAGQASNWNKYLKLTCYKFADNQVRNRGDYRTYYDNRKEFEQTKELTKMHVERRARRYMIKKFLSDVRYNLLDHC